MEEEEEEEEEGEEEETHGKHWAPCQLLLVFLKQVACQEKGSEAVGGGAEERGENYRDSHKGGQINPKWQKNKPAGKITSRVSSSATRRDLQWHHTALWAGRLHPG